MKIELEITMNTLHLAGRYTLLCIASLTIMVGALVAPGLVSIAENLGVSENAILLMTLPSLGAVIFAPIAGKCIDKYGAYPSLVGGLFLYGLLGISVYWLHGSVTVFLSRLLLGGATAVVMAGCTVLMSQWYFGKERLEMIAKQGMAIELGGVLFLFVGGFLAAQYWALPLSLYLAAWVFLVMLLLFIPRKHPTEQTSDEVDRQSIPSTELSLRSVYLVAVLSMITFFTTVVLLPGAMHTLQYNEEEIGLLLALVSLTAVFAAGVMPKIVSFLKEQGVLALAFICYGCSYFFFLQSTTALLVIGAIFSGIGFGFSIPLLNHMTVERSEEKVRGRNLSYFTMAVFSGQFLTSFMDYVPGGIHNVFISCIVTSLLIAFGLLIARRKAVAQ